MMVEIHVNKEIKKMKNPVVVVGFPGTGLVGSVAASHLVERLKLKFGGYISSPEFAPLAAIHNYTPLPAARIHYSQKHNLIVILSEMSIPVSLSLELANKLFEFAQNIRAAQIVILGGISLEEDKNKVYVVSSSRELIKEISEKRIAKPIKEGATTGVTGILLTKGTIENFPVTTLLAESAEDYLDPGAAARVVKSFSKFTEIRVPTLTLEKEAKELDENISKSNKFRKGPSTSETMYG